MEKINKSNENKRIISWLLAVVSRGDNRNSDFIIFIVCNGRSTDK